MKRKVQHIIDSQDVKMGEHTIGQPLPVAELEQISPFILLHHGEPKYYAPGTVGPGVAPHPHRGFEPVSFVFRGELEHRDSRENHSVVRDGGVQWMTAGMGIIHSERATRAFNEAGGVFEMIQLWINLPRKLKMVEPNYQAFEREEIPYFETGAATGKSRVNVIAGEMRGLQGPVKSLTGVTALTLEIQTGDDVDLKIPADRNVLLYQLHGDSSINGHDIGDKQLVSFDNEGDEFTIQARSESLILLLAGDPIDEPVVSHGPFVMTSETEILEAMRDYQIGKMGYLPAHL